MGVYLSKPETSKSMQESSGNKLRFCCAQMQGWRKNMEDAVIHEVDIGDGNSLFAVFDGHGGSEVSQYIKKIFVPHLIALPQYKNNDYETALDIAFKDIDDILKSEQGKKDLHALRLLKTEDNTPTITPLTPTPPPTNSIAIDNIANGVGCTANVMLMTPTHYYVANAGDSRSVLCRKGETVPLSFDHKPECEIEYARIKKAGGVVAMGRVNGGLNLTRSFGDFDYKKSEGLPYDQQMITCKPDIVKISRETGDEFVILGCDGIWERYVDNSQPLIELIKQQLKDQKPLKQLITDLLDQLLAKQVQLGIGCDNMSVVLVLID